MANNSIVIELIPNKKYIYDLGFIEVGVGEYFSLYSIVHNGPLETHPKVQWGGGEGYPTFKSSLV
jgi:hypothetical protein